MNYKSTLYIGEFEKKTRAKQLCFQQNNVNNFRTLIPAQKPTLIALRNWQ